uniref:COMM domain-containing protein n=1 Tax=Heligmosomoides polygyrus TaxID=6339 RepID=A0A8L8JYW1_HELPZ
LWHLELNVEVTSEDATANLSIPFNMDDKEIRTMSNYLKILADSKKAVEKLVRGAWIPSQHEMQQSSFTTKACVIASLVFTLERNSMYVTAPHDLVYLCVVGFFVYFKLSALTTRSKRSLCPVENLFCAVFMGGIRDALHKDLH